MRIQIRRSLLHSYLSHRDDDRIEMVVIEKLELEANPNITVITRRYDEVISPFRAQMN
ncbi:hypothetical protein [Fulvivirga kasyanovii]|uniref:hypothetical protein n=1 Tax=Fulvivirga kasyanovii TaxID=396812 RepID=UPI0031D3B4BD